MRTFLLALASVLALTSCASPVNHENALFVPLVSDVMNDIRREFATPLPQ